MTSQDLMVRAADAYASGNLEAAFEAMEEAHASCERAGDRIGAAGAAARIAMHLLIDTGLVAPVRGWIKRAERLLEGEAPTPVHAWLALARSYERFQSGDFSAARRYAEEAIETGRKLGEPSAAAMAEIARARSYIFDGDVETGLELLEEAAVSATSSDVDPLTTGLSYCEIVCAWQGIAMYDLAEQWTETMERFSARHGIGSVSGRCRIHRAEILRLRGDCDAAEAEALAACNELRPYMRREFGWPLTELGMIRLRMGDLEGAEESFLAAHEMGWEPQPGLALLRLAQGDVAAASALISDAIERPIELLSKELPPNNDLRRAPLLEAQVEIAVAAGDVGTAERAGSELRRIAETFKSKALQAASAMATGRIRLAKGDPDAVLSFRQALHLWSEISAPYEAAQARMGLGFANRAKGFDEGALLEFKAAHATFERICASEQAATALRAIEGAGHTPIRRDEPSVFVRDGDYWTITFDGETALINDMKGLRYLQRLIGEAGREMHVVDLVGLEEGAAEDLVHRASDHAGEMLDEKAKAMYRRRLAEIEEDIEEAHSFGDSERVSRSETERDFLVREISRAVGMHGRDRRAGATSERARAAVTRAIRNAMKRISEHHTSLGEHLALTIRTGTYCAYKPDPRSGLSWSTKAATNQA